MSRFASSCWAKGAVLAVLPVALFACGGASDSARGPGASLNLDVAAPAATYQAAVEPAAPTPSQSDARAADSTPQAEVDDRPLAAALAGPSGGALPGRPAALPGAAPVRSKALLQTELRSLEALLQSAPASSADRPSLLLRLAQRYSSLASIAQSEGDSALQQSARAKAIEAYDRARLDYPRQPSADEALYGLGSELLLAGDAARARKTLLELIQAFPNSSFVPHAYALFGDVFFDEAAADPAKLALARQAYLKVMTIPTASAELRSYASYRLGWTEMNLSNLPESLAAFVRSIEAASAQVPMTARAQRLAKAARTDLVVAYARAGQPNRAYSFLARYSGDPAGQHAATVELVGRLAQLYAAEGKVEDSLVVGEELLTRHPEAPTCEVVRRVVGQAAPLATGAQSAHLTAVRVMLAKACGIP